MEFPSFIANRISLFPSVIPAETSSSSSSIEIAIIPVDLGLLKASRFVFLTTPFFVAIITYLSSENSLTGTKEQTFSSEDNFRIFTIALPFVALPA